MSFIDSRALWNAALLVVAVLAAGATMACEPIELATHAFYFATTPCPFGAEYVISTETGTPGLRKFTEKWCQRKNEKGEAVRYGPYVELYEKGHKKETGRYDHEGQRDGTWMRWYPGGARKAMIVYDAGKPVSLAAWHESGLKWEQGSFDNGFKNGPWHRWHSNGQKEIESFYDHGVLDRNFTVWHDNGQKQELGAYKHGVREGLWVKWHANGQKQNEILFHDGQPDDWFRAWHANGQQATQALFNDGKPEGVYTIWHDNGQKEEEGVYHGGVLDGKVTAWDREGRVWLKTEYKGGSLAEDAPPPESLAKLGDSRAPGSELK